MGFPEKLKEARLKMGYTQQQVANAMNITSSTYCGYETGKRQPDVAKIKLLARILNTSGDDLLETGFTNKKASSSKPEEEAIKIAKKFEALDGFGKSAVRSIIDVEEARMKADQVRREQFDDMKRNKIIRLFQYSQPVSAGTGAQLDDEDGKIIEVILNRETAAADFCLRVSGHSMEPTYENGDIILIRSQPDIEYGEDGIFIIDGAGYVKEKGPDCLISKNYEYPDIFPEEGSPIKCVGKVIGILNPYDIIK
mgnify:CR=1 FL=1